MMALVVVMCTATSSLAGTKVTLRLVRSDEPAKGVSTAVTKIDPEAEKRQAAAEKETIEAMKGGKFAAEVPKDFEVKPKAQFDRYCNYMRGIVIDGKVQFQRTYQGSFLGRTDELTLDLADGEHVIEPGSHKFAIAGGKITTSDPTMRVRGDTSLDITLFPVTVMAVDGSAVRRMPAEVLRLPVAPRLFWNDVELLPKEKELADSATFKRLTLYMLANSDGAGYRLTPSDRRFHVTPAGAISVDDKGLPSTDGGLLVEDKFTLVAPKAAVPVTVLGEGTQVLISGPAGRLKLEATQKGEATDRFYAFAAPGGAEVTIGRRGQSAPVHFEGDLGVFPRRKILVDGRPLPAAAGQAPTEPGAAEPGAAEPRMIMVGLNSYSADAGKGILARVQVADSLDNPTLKPLQVAAYMGSAVLGEDGWLADAPDGADVSWRALRVKATDKSDVYEIVLPEVPSSVYWLRIVAGRRGECSPAAPLRCDFIQGVINPAARTSVSVFCPTARHSYPWGSEVPISVVIRSSAAIEAGKMRLVLRPLNPPSGNANEEYLLVERDMPALPAGSHSLHFALAGPATAALACGDYQLKATLGNTASNTWSVRIVEPRWKRPFPVFADGDFSGSNVDHGALYMHTPASIAQANQQRRIFARNAEVLASYYDSVFLFWCLWSPLQKYQGRDNSSEVAEVERVLRDHASLPAAEVYYYQNHFESCSEALIGQGIGHINSVVSSFSPISLIHSVPTEVDSDMRKYQLIAQMGQKFENLQGLSLLYPNTDPLGNTELVDANRHFRMQAFRENFQKNNGFDMPAMSDASRFLQAYMKSPDSEPMSKELTQAAYRWETWTLAQNTLEGDYYARTRQALRPISPQLQISNQGPSGGSTGPGTYVPTCHANHDLIEIWSGFSDFGWPVIIEDFLRPHYFATAGAPMWGCMSMGDTPGPRNLKNHLAAYLASGVEGLGYMYGPTIDDCEGYPHVEQNIRDVNSFVQTYGPMFRQARPKAAIAVYYPFRQTMYDRMAMRDERWNRNCAMCAMYSALAQMAMCAHDAEVITDEMIDRGELDRFQVVLMPVLHYTLPKHAAALEKFAATKGKTLLHGSGSTLRLKGARQVDDEFSEIHEADVLWSLAYPLDDAHAYMFAGLHARVPKLKAALDQCLLPFAQPQTDRVFVNTSIAGQGRVTIVWSFLYPSFLGTPRLTGVSNNSMFDGEANEKTMMPLRERLSFPDNYYVYDLLTQKLVEKDKAANGRFETIADMSATPFRVYVGLPAPIARLKLELPASLTLGGGCGINLTPLAAGDKTIDASIPVQLTVLDAQGKVVSQATDAAMPTARMRLAAPLGFAAGKWRIVAKELVSGREVEAALDVAAPASLPFGAAISELPAVEVQRGELIKQFVLDRRKDGKSVLVLLDDSQVARRLAAAQEVVKQLTALGVKAQIKRTSEAGVFGSGERVHLFAGWSELNPAQFVPHHAVLLGGEGESTLTEELQESQLLVRPMSANYPGAGRGVLALIRSPFAFGYDVLCCYGGDDAGVAAAIAELAKAQTFAAKAEQPQAAAPPLVAHVLEGTLKPGSAFENQDGPPVQSIAVSPAGDAVAFGTSSYGNNVVVLNPADGSVLADQKVGHINTQDLTLYNAQLFAVSSDGRNYLRQADGTVSWQIRGRVMFDPQGRYLVANDKGTLQVYNLALKSLWSFDEWTQFETTKEILFGRKAQLVAMFDNGNTLAYRLAGKSPGLTGTFGDHMIFCEALTGKEIRRVSMDSSAVLEAAGLDSPREQIEAMTFHQNGQFVLATVKADRVTVDLLLDSQLNPILVEKFPMPTYVSGSTVKTNRHVLADKRLLFTAGDMLCVSNPEWTTLTSAKTAGLILSMAVNEAAGRVTVSNYAGQLITYDLALKELWRADIASAAKLRYLADGRLAVGTLRGVAMLFDAAGKPLWNASLQRYTPPEEVEAHWTRMEALPTVQSDAGLTWWQRLKNNVELGDDQARIKGTLAAGKQLTARFEGAAFSTYLVEWTHGESPQGADLSLEVYETAGGDKNAPKGSPARVRRLGLTARATSAARSDFAVLRLGDSPRPVVDVVLKSAGNAQSGVSIRPLLLPGANHIRIASLYNGQITEAERTSPPCRVEMFFNVTETDRPHDARWADAYNLINGRMFEAEKGLLKGKWFGSGTTWRQGSNTAIIPCWVELTLPKKKVITHIVIAQDPALAKVKTLSIDALIESRETRVGMSEHEKRQVARGFWFNAVRDRNPGENYLVYKLPKPIFTRTLRVYVLEGFSAINEIELYGVLSAPATGPAAAK